MDEIRRQKIIAKIQKLRLMDDFFMRRFFEDNPQATQFVLNTILGRDDLTVKKVSVQKNLQSLIGHGVCLDVLAVDEQGKYYNIEVQRAVDGADYRRARYNGSILDTYILGRGEDYKQIPDTYVIFIMEKDIFGCGYPIYEIEKIVKQNGQKIDDGAHIIYVNTEYRADDPYGRLMADFCNPNPETMNCEVLKVKCEYLKVSEKGVSSMCAFSEELLAEGRVEGRAEGRVEGRAEGEAESALGMLRDDMPVKLIMKYTQLSLEKIQELAASIGVAVVM